MQFQKRTATKNSNKEQQQVQQQEQQHQITRNDGCIVLSVGFPLVVMTSV